MRPLISIGMPVFNCERTLRAAVQSIINQTYSDWELLLIVDDSTDNTLNVAQSFQDIRIKVITDGLKKDLATRLNQAIEMSKGKYFARMDGDDIAYPERLELQMEYLETHPDIDLLGSKVIVFKGDGQAIGTHPVRKSHAKICRRPWAGFYLAHPTWMGRIEWFRKYLYRPDALRAEDQDLLLRTYKNSQFECLPYVLLGYRQDSLSLKKILISRYNLSKVVFREYCLERAYFIAFRGVAEQLFKAMVDFFAISTGLEYRILRHRALPVDTEILHRWGQVWTLYKR